MSDYGQARVSQGGESNLSGQFLERCIQQEFEARGVPVFSFEDNRYNNDWVSECQLLKNVPYTSIYGCKSRSEFLYRDCRLDTNIRIECRWQQVPGSVDEKLPYLYMNAVEAMPEQEIWLVLEGDGARAEAINWLKQKCASVAAKKIRVMAIAETRQRIKHLRV